MEARVFCKLLITASLYIVLGTKSSPRSYSGRHQIEFGQRHNSATDQASTMGKLRIAAWNIRGLASKNEHKLDDPKVTDFILGNDIAAILESHTNTESNLNVRGYM